MKILALAVLLAVVQAASPIPRKAANHSIQTTQNVESQGSADATSSPRSAEVNSQPHADTPKSDGQTYDSENASNSVAISKLPAVTVNASKRDWPDWAYWGFSLLLALTSGLQVWLLCRTLTFVRRQAHEMKRQRCYMRLQWKAMQEQAMKMQEQISEMKNQTTHLEGSVAVAKESANAAKLSAEIAVGISVPTLVVHELDIGEHGAASMEAILQFPTIKLVIKNYGQTPALLHSWTVVFTCEDLPEVPVYFDFPGSGMVLDKVAVQPNEAYTLPRIPSWKRQEFSLDDVKAIISRKKMLTVYGYVAFRDIFGNPMRRLKFCETALNLMDGPTPLIHWADFQFSAYTGTDLYPITKPSSGRGTRSQPSGADAKTENRTEEAN